jgi:cobalt-zinc-cadmium efflux system outer membrane protein
LRSAAAAAAGALLLGACATAPKDAGFGDVSRTVAEQVPAPLAWDPTQPVTEPDHAALAALLQEELTAERAVEVAFAHNRDLQATLDGLGVARADMLQATSVRNPLFHIEARFPADPKVPIELGVAQTLVDLLSRGRRKEKAQAEFDIVRTRVAAAVVNFAAEVRSDWLDLVAARRVLDRHQALLRAQAAATELAQRQHAAGNVTDLDLEHEQARYEAVKLEHARVQLAEVSAREQLVRDLGLLQPAALDLPDDFPPLPAADPTPEEVEAQLAARRMDLQIARAELVAAAGAAGIAKTSFLDEMTLGVHYESEPDGKKTFGPELEIPIPIFDRGSPARQRAHARLRQAQQRLLALAVNARSQAREAQERIAEARARASYLRDVVVPRRARIVQLTLSRYTAMLVGPYDLLKARQDLARAEKGEIEATRDYWRARTELETTLAGVGSFAVERAGGRLPRRAEPGDTNPEPDTKEH